MKQQQELSDAFTDYALIDFDSAHELAVNILVTLSELKAARKGFDFTKEMHLELENQRNITIHPKVTLRDKIMASYKSNDELGIVKL